MFDEMSIKKNLFYNRRDDIIEGFQDHASQGRTPQIASYVLVFMIAGIRKKVKQPIAYYFSGGSVTADRLAVLIKGVLQHCFEAGLNIATTVCDLDGVNKRALGILGASAENPYIEIQNKEVVTLFDTPHLLKCFRNLFLKYDIKCPTNITSDDKSGTGLAKWTHIQNFHEVDSRNPNFVFAPCIKKEHLTPNTKQKMKVKLAAQILSHSVAAGMYAKISQGELSTEATTTAEILSNMDKLFDILNAQTPDLRRGKPYSTNLSNKTQLLFKHIKCMKNFIKKIEYIGIKRSPPSQEGWIWTLNGVERLWRNLTTKHKNIKSLATRRLQQDPLENLFGCICGNCGSNTNPTVGQFAAGLKTAILSNLSHLGVGNCEKDENEVILNDYKTLFTPAKDTHTDDENNIIRDVEYQCENIFQFNLEEGSGEMQACAYVSGFIIKKYNVDCDICKELFTTKECEWVHSFLNFKEYSELKRSLQYATKKFIICVESCASVINNFLKTEAHSLNIRLNIIELLQKCVNFDFLDDCITHKKKNMTHIINCVFFICIKRFCTVKNRLFTEEASMSALKKEMDILKHK